MSVSPVFFTTALPPITTLGEAPPVSGAELLGVIAGTDIADAVRMVLLGDDLVRHLGARSGLTVDEDDEPAVLDTKQIAGEVPLPEDLTRGADDPRAPTDHELTAAWLRWCARTAAATGSRFLADWVAFEVLLRNELAELRGELLGFEADHVVAILTDLQSRLDHDRWAVAEAVDEVRQADDPLHAQRAMDEARWAWVAAHDPRFAFSDDEAVAYAVRLGLTTRWNRIARAGDTGLKGAA